MKKLLFAVSLLILLSGTSFAETRYISDMLIVTIRSQPRNGATTLTTVQTGDPLEILGEVKDFLHVRTQEGVEGYVLSQYVTEELPKAEQLKQLETKNSRLRRQVEKLSANLGDSKQKIDRLNATEKELARITEEYRKLQQISADALQISRERDQLRQENSTLMVQLQQLQEQNNLYLRTAVIKWFLAGAGVLLAGWILGKISRKKNRYF